MISHYLYAFALGLSLTTSQVSAQSAGGNVSVPSDLSGGFKPDEVTLQVSFTGQSDNGFASGSNVPQDQVTKTPTFALGDASGVNTEIQYTIFMVDTTSSNDRVLHYVHSNFKATEVKTGIASSSNPVLPWQAPGSLNDTGPGRTYTFLLYEQNGQFPNQDMPALGQSVDVQEFAQANDLPKAIAGIVMQVDVSGPASTSAGSSPASSSELGNVVAGSSVGSTSVIGPDGAATAAPSAVLSSSILQGAAGAVASVLPSASTAAVTAITTTILTTLPASSSSVGPLGTSTASATPAAASNDAGRTFHIATWSYCISAGILIVAGGLTY